MCGRYALYAPASRVARDAFGVRVPIGDRHAQYNLCPGNAIDVFAAAPREDHTTYPIDHHHSVWGYQPHWAPNGPVCINARAETMATSKYFRDAFTRHRVVIPASGWFEWERREDGKQPYFFAPAGEEFLMFAGIQAWTGSGDNYTVAIITEPARGPAATIHDRMPLILDRECWLDWIDTERIEPDAIRAATKRRDPEAIRHWPVSRAVNSPKAKGSELVKPVEG